MFDRMKSFKQYITEAKKGNGPFPVSDADKKRLQRQTKASTESGEKIRQGLESAKERTSRTKRTVPSAKKLGVTPRVLDAPDGTKVVTNMPEPARGTTGEVVDRVVDKLKTTDETQSRGRTASPSKPYGDTAKSGDLGSFIRGEQGKGRPVSDTLQDVAGRKGGGYDFPKDAGTEKPKPTKPGSYVVDDKPKSKPRVKGNKPVIPKVRPRGIGRVFGRIPIVGPLIDFTISLIMGDPIGKAAAGAVRAAVGSAIGGALVGSGTLGLGAFLGAAVGGFIGDLIARSLYDAVAAMSGTREKYNQGGVVASRQIKSETKPKGDTKKTISPVELQSRFSENDLKTLYGDSVGILAKISGIMSSPGGFIGSLMSSSINLLFGQKFDDRLLSYIRQTFGRGVESNVRSTVDTVVRNLELYLAFNQKTKKKSDEEEESDKNLLNKIVEFFRGGGKTDPPPADSDSPPVDKTFLNMKGGRLKKLRRIRGDEDTTDAPNAKDPYVYDDGSILAPGMEVGSLQMTPTYAKHMEFTYAIQPVMVG